MSRALTILYGAVMYTAFLGVFLYLIGFLANFFVPWSVDVGGPEAATGTAILVNVLLIVLFGVQHSVMARPGFKQAWTRIVPRPIERSTYLLFSNLVLVLLYWQWRPLPGTIWDVSNPIAATVVWVVFALGIGLVLLSTFLIDHFDLFGLKQVFNYARGKEHEDPKFKLNLLYRFVRHPLYLGWLTMFWVTPQMTIGHLVFAGGMTVYILIAIQVEERDLIAFHGQDYEDYRREVPMLFPTGKRYEPRREVQPG